MTSINMIAAVDMEWGIGFDNKLLFHLKKDMNFFRQKTVGNVVIMGRKTLESFPHAKPLPERINIVLSADNRSHMNEDNLLWMSSLDEVLAYAETTEKDVFVIGGEQVYHEFLPFASRIYLTKIKQKKEADAFFPNLDAMPEWRQTSRKKDTEDGTEFEFVCYEKSRLKHVRTRG